VLGEGETFVIPRGMIHFQYNVGDVAAQVITAFNSQLPGVVAAAPSLFGSDPEIPDAVLAENYQVDVKIIRLLKSKF
jgi:oxalate decarboxylase/phosphoglucose isomerase-like protein (cupin superfamily)